jgi:Recombination endonuclease VII
MDNYKLTIAQWNRIFEHQSGVCYACHNPEPVKGRRLSVDHDHATGEVRGLLCSRCNPILGKLERAYMRYGLGSVLGLTVAKYALRISHYLFESPASKALGMKHFGYAGRTGTKKHRIRLRRERRQNATSRTTITGKAGEN